MHTITLSFDILTAVFAFAAAYVWLQSAKVKTPNNFSIHVIRPDIKPLGDNPLGGAYLGQGFSQDLINLGNALSKQSKLSAHAAIFAAIAAILQAASVLIKLI